MNGQGDAGSSENDKNLMNEMVYEEIYRHSGEEQIKNTLDGSLTLSIGNEVALVQTMHRKGECSKCITTVEVVSVVPIDKLSLAAERVEIPNNERDEQIGSLMELLDVIKRSLLSPASADGDNKWTDGAGTVRQQLESVLTVLESDPFYSAHVNGDNVSESQSQLLQLLESVVGVMMTTTNGVEADIDAPYLLSWGRCALLPCEEMLTAQSFVSLCERLVYHEEAEVRHRAATLIKQRVSRFYSTDSDADTQGLTELHMLLRGVVQKFSLQSGSVGAHIAHINPLMATMHCLAELADFLCDSTDSKVTLIDTIGNLITLLGELVGTINSELPSSDLLLLTGTVSSTATNLAVQIQETAEAALLTEDDVEAWAQSASILVTCLVSGLKGVGELIVSGATATASVQDQAEGEETRVPRQAFVELALDFVSDLDGLVSGLGEVLVDAVPTIYSAVMDIRAGLLENEVKDCGELVEAIDLLVQSLEDCVFSRAFAAAVTSGATPYPARPGGRHRLMRSGRSTGVLCDCDHIQKRSIAGHVVIKTKGRWNENGHFYPDFSNFYTHYATAHSVDQRIRLQYLRDADTVKQPNTIFQPGPLLRQRKPRQRRGRRRHNVQFNSSAEQFIVDSREDLLERHGEEQFVELFVRDSSLVKANRRQLQEDAQAARDNNKLFTYLSDDEEQSDTQPAGAVQRDCSALSDSQLVDLFDAHLEQLSGVRGVTLYQTKSIVADRMNNDGWPHNATVHSLKFRKSTEKRHPKTHAKLLAALNAVEFELQSFFAHEDGCCANPANHVTINSEASVTDDGVNDLSGCLQGGMVLDDGMQIVYSGKLTDGFDGAELDRLPQTSDDWIGFPEPSEGSSRYAGALRDSIRALAECNASSAESDVRERALRVVHNAFMLRKHGASEDVPALMLQAVDDFYGTTDEPIAAVSASPAAAAAMQFARKFRLD